MKEGETEKIFIEKEGEFRLISEQGITQTKIFDQLRKIFKVNIFKNRSTSEKIVLVEEKEEED